MENIKEQKIRVREIKIKFNSSLDFKPILEKYLLKRSKESIASSFIKLQDIIDLIYDSYPDLRAN